MHKSSSEWGRVFKKSGKQSIEKTKGGFNNKIHMINPSERTLIIFSLSKGQTKDAPESRKLLKKLEKTKKKKFVPLDKTYEGDEPARLAESPNSILKVSLKSNLKAPRKHDKILYKCRNETERRIRKLKRSGRILNRSDRTTAKSGIDIVFASIIDSLFIPNTTKNNIATKQTIVISRTNIHTVQEGNNYQYYQSAKF